MDKYKKPHLKLGEVLLLLDEDYYDADIINEDGKVEFSGEIGELRGPSEAEHYVKLRERYVDRITFDEWGEYVIYLESK